MILLLLLLLAWPLSAQVSSGGGVVGIAPLVGQPTVQPTFWQKMPNGSGTTVTAFLGDNGITSNGTAWVAHGTNNFGLDFDASDDLAAFGTNYDAVPATDYSVTAWVAMDSFGEAGTGRIIGKSTGTTQSWNMAITSTNNRLQMRCATNTSAAGDTFVGDADSFLPYIGSSYVFVAATCSGCASMGCSSTLSKLYINGVEINTTHLTDSSGTNVDDSTFTLNIGSFQGGANTVEGDIDDVRLYPKVLTAAEVFWIYKGGPQ